uniref:Methyltransferase family protein n=1 Tax=Desulfovibrio sp. U5L TaxID=596152 RepID=I2Q7Q4_9BACT
MDYITDIVARQYSDWVYPAPIEDMVQAMADGYYEYGSPAVSLPLLWPERRSLNGLKVLIAGCGTNQAAYYALALPEAKITAVDISRTSLEHTQYLKEKHGLTNLFLYKMSLLDVTKLGESFDFIVCTGVLHHMPDPDAGLRVLRDVLAPDGLMNIMVYGQMLRIGVYMLQDAFRRLRFEQTQQDLDLVKSTINSLPKNHIIQNYLSIAEDLKYDSGIVDTFLHTQDRAYTVPQVLEFARSNGLEFWDWVDRKEYCPTALIPLSHPIMPRILALRPEEQWAVVELILQKIGTHRFFFCHRRRLRQVVRPNFDNHSWTCYVPVLREFLTVQELGDIASGKLAKLKRGWHEFSLNRLGIALMSHIDGVKTITQVLEHARSSVPDLTMQQTREFFQTMQDWGHVMFWLEAEKR